MTTIGASTNRDLTLSWVAGSKGQTIDSYLAAHRFDSGIDELKLYFSSVIDWISAVFTGIPDKSMRGLDWGRLYEAWHTNAYNPADIAAKVEDLLADPAVDDRRGVYEYLLGGESDTRLLGIRLFDAATKRIAYNKQTQAAKVAGASNCPLCATGNNANKVRIYKLDEMDADHVTAWSNGGATTIENCEILCVSHNRAKGNR